MKECKENHSTSKSIEASSIKKFSQSDSKHRTCLSKERNENEQDFQFHDQTQMASRMLPPKESIPKHFMSPTISATFKAKKRILTEKNEVSSPTLHTTTPTSENLAFHRFPLSPLSSTISESNFHDSGSKPYDPLTNFLSPRPTFRLYDPDKRVKVLRCLEKTSQMVDGETSSFSLSSSSTQETSLQEEDSARDAFDDDSDEELDEEKHDGILSKVMKVLLLLALLIVSTVYISSMNSTSSTASSLQDKWGLINKIPKIRTVFVVDTNDLMRGSVFLNQTLEKIARSMKVAKCDLNEKFEEKDMSKQVLEKLREFSEKINLSVERDRAGETFDFVQVSESQLVPNWMDYTDKILFDKLPVPLNEVLTENIITSEGTGKEVVVEHDIPEPDLTYTCDHVVDETIELREPKLITPWEMDQLPIEKISSDTSRVYEDIASEGTGKDEVVVEHDIPEPDLTYTYDHVVDETIELREPKLITPWEMDQHSTENMRSETSGVYEDTESFSHKIDERRIILGEILHTCEVDMNSGRRLGDQTRKTESIATEVVVVVGGIALLAGLLRYLAGLLRLIYLKFRNPSRKDSSVSIQSYVKSIVLEEDGGLPSDRKTESTKEKEQFIEAEYHFNPPPCLQSEVDKFICGSAPTVKLLGEYVIPAEFSSSALKTYSRKSSPEAQQRKWGISPCTPSAPQLRPSTGLKSNGKSTSEEKIMRKEEGIGGKPDLLIPTTPLRRSSRIRSKAVMSP